MFDASNATAATISNLNRQFEVTAHNLANVSTAGYKRQRISFASVLAAEGEPQSGETVAMDFTQGSLIQTGRPLDVALEGKGFFVVETPQGRRYTRNGSLRLNGDGQLVDFMNRPVVGESGPITIPSSVSSQTIQIAADGAVYAGGRKLDTLRIMSFKDLTMLMPIGQGSFVPHPDAEAVMAPDVRVHQGYTEASNVNLIEELVGMITTTRLFEANLKAISTRDDYLQSILRVAMS